jgi:hypothetical protein
MSDIVRLLFGGGDDGGERDWSGRGGRPRVADSREWCGTEPGADAIAGIGRALRGFGGARRQGRGPSGQGSRPGPFGML